MLRSELAPAPTHQAAVLCHFIEPHHERFGTVELGQVRNRLEQYLLHGVFSVLALAADAHTKGEHSILEQSQSLLQRRIVTPLQELHGFFYLRTHCRKCSMANFRLTQSCTTRRKQATRSPTFSRPIKLWFVSDNSSFRLCSCGFDREPGAAILLRESAHSRPAHVMYSPKGVINGSLQARKP